MLRYRLDRSTRHVVESHYWTPDGQWTSFPLGGVYPEIRVPVLRWPDWAYEYFHHAREPEPAKVLKEAIEEAERRSTSEQGGR